MSKLSWDQVGKHFFETGIAHGVLYPMDSHGIYEKGVVWNGLTKISEKISDSSVTFFYVDGVKYYNHLTIGDFSASIEAYTYPDEFIPCDGSLDGNESADGAIGLTIGQQIHKPFGLCYQTLLGNDLRGQDLGYKLHLIYGAQAHQADKEYGTLNDSSDAISFNWDVDVTPVRVPNFKPIASLVVDSTKVDPIIMTELEKILYGTDTTDPRLPLPVELINLLSSVSWIVGLSLVGPSRIN